MSSARARLRALTFAWVFASACVWDPYSGLPMGCGKVPFIDINAGFTIADASWFQDEQTMFVFYRVDAEQGIGPDSVIELTYRTDDLVVPWTPIAELPTVHPHVPVDCGEKARCGSTSLAVAKVPRQVRLRLRYHAKSELSLDANTVFNVVGDGPAHLIRSLVVYGVFDEDNTHVQWRARHQFPTIRNEQATSLGLRRHFEVDGATYGTLADLPADNAYGYAVSPICPLDFVDLAWPKRETEARALFEESALPLAASTASAVCGAATVTDAIGSFTTAAFARKNPEVKGGFPALRSPIRTNIAVPIVMRICDRVISEDHLAMQRQRLLIDQGATEICLDEFANPGFPDRVTSLLRARIDAERLRAEDMVLTIALHHDDTTGRLQRAVETGLAQTLITEREKSSPKVSGAFLLDSSAYVMTVPVVKQLTLWCPAVAISNLPIDQVPDTAQRDCPVLPDQPDIVLGPFKINQLPILATRKQYLDFITKYSVAQAGAMKTLTFLAPERSAVSTNIPIGDFAVVTRFNNELISAEPTDAFSFCPSEDLGVARMVVVPVGGPQGAAFPLSSLPQTHATTPFQLYALGLAWESPFLLRAEYTSSLAASATVAGFTIPFGIDSVNERFLGSELWKRDVFPVGDALIQCTRYCAHPTFDSIGVYQPLQPFDRTYADQCYRPAFPVPPGGGFPSDP